MVHSIRVAEELDLPAVGRLAGELVRMHYAWDPLRWMMPDEVERGYARFFASRLDEPDTIILVAQEGPDDAFGAPAGIGGRSVVGYAYAALEPRSWADLRDACGKLHDLFVLPSARRQGIGTALAQAALARLRDLGVPRVVLTSAWQNQEAHALFRALGFRETMIEMARECAPGSPGENRQDRS